jgi:hypothetical protein
MSGASSSAWFTGRSAFMMVVQILSTYCCFVVIIIAVGCMQLHASGGVLISK